MKEKQREVIKKKESLGRSMVEMLGVLAVIGVLSLGGILGYMYAMNYYQANSIANEMNLMRTDAKLKLSTGANQLKLGSPYDDSHVINFNNYGTKYDCLDWAEDTDITTAPVAPCNEANAYFIEVQNVSAGVCKPLGTLLSGMDEKILLTVNDEAFAVGLCTEEKNNLTVFFELAPDFTGQDIPEEENSECDTDDDCPHYCVAGECVECKNNGDCGNKICDQSKGVCVNCSSDTDCGSDYCLDNTVCVECTQNNQCESGVCTDSHTCGSCAGDEDCDEELYCNTDTGICVHCRTAADCGAGQACVDNACSDSCTDDTECRTDEYCEDGNVCQNVKAMMIV